MMSFGSDSGERPAVGSFRYMVFQEVLKWLEATEEEVQY
jgi:hypothetical protein